MRGASRHKTKEQRFWARVEKRGPDDCWPWRKSKDRYGYGKFYHRGEAFIAHRVAFELSSGQPEEGLHVLHRCDNPACCNPAHLWAGTHTDNMRDMVAKGRAAGSNHGPRKVAA